MTETWLKHDETQSTIADISPPGYSFFHEPRADQGAGRDVGILVSDQFETDIHPLPSFKTFETISAHIGNNSFSGFVRYWTDGGLRLEHRCRRWTGIGRALDRWVLFAG